MRKECVGSDRKTAPVGAMIGLLPQPSRLGRKVIRQVNRRNPGSLTLDEMQGEPHVILA